jgi:hypothetical protein
MLDPTGYGSESTTLHMVAMSVHCTVYCSPTFKTIFQTQTMQKYMYVRTQSTTVPDHAGKQLNLYFMNRSGPLCTLQNAVDF